MPLVRATESGKGQTESPLEREERCGVWSQANALDNKFKFLERDTLEGDSPVDAFIRATSLNFQSTVRRISRGNTGLTKIQP